MSSLSQFLSAATQPVGSVIRVSNSVTADLLTQNGAEYLRLGKLVPYQSKYALAASIGLVLNRWPAKVTLGGNINTTIIPTSYQTAIDRKMFAKGVMGTLSHIGNQTYVFTGIHNTTGLSSPVVLKPPYQGGGTWAGHIPHYLSAHDMWVALDYAPSTGAVFIYTSKDGSSWKTTTIPSGSGLIFSGSTNASAIATTRSCVYFAVHTAANNLTIYKITITSSGDAVMPPVTVTNYASAFLTGSQVGYTVGPDDAVFVAGSSSTTSLLCFDDSSTADRNYQIGSSTYTANNQPLYFDRNPTTGVICITTPVPGSHSVQYGTRVGNLTGYALGAVNSSAAGLTFLYTGAYWIYFADNASTLGVYYSSNDGASWTFYSTGVNNLLGTLRGTVFKNHLIVPKSGQNKVFQLASGTDSGTNPPTTGGFGYLIQTTLFNGNHVTLREQCISQTTASYGGEDLKYWNSTASVPLYYLTRFKTVNGRLFANGLGSGSSLSSNDGIAWTKTDIAGFSAQCDVTYVNSRYVMVGYGTTSNNYYSTDLSTWTAGSVVSTAGTPLQQVFTIGTAAVALSNSLAARRTTDGATWSTIATLGSAPMTNTSYFVEGTTAYVYMHTSASSGCIRYISTDSGATWASAVTNIKGAGSSVYPVPHSIIKYNNLYYSIVGAKAYNDSGYQYGVHTSTDLINWTPLNFLGETKISTTDVIPTLYVDANGILMMNSSTSGSGGPTDVALVLEGSSTGYIGSQEIVSNTVGETGFVRIA